MAIIRIEYEYFLRLSEQTHFQALTSDSGNDWSYDLLVNISDHPGFVNWSRTRLTEDSGLKLDLPKYKKNWRDELKDKWKEITVLQLEVSIWWAVTDE